MSDSKTTTPVPPAAAAPARAQREGSSSLGTFGVKSGLAQMLKGGVIMDVVNAEQARIAEEAGACAVMALERVPADIRADGGVARMSDPHMIKVLPSVVLRNRSIHLPATANMRSGYDTSHGELWAYLDQRNRNLTLDSKAKVRIGHFVEAQILQQIGVDYIDESEHSFKIPFVCGARNLGEALRRISEGAAFIRTKGEAGTGNVVEAVRHQRAVDMEIRKASEIQAPFHLLKETARLKRLPVVSFAAGGIATPADAALMMQLGCDGVFVGSGIFKSGDAAKRARAIVQAVTHYNNPKILADCSENLGEAMVGLSIDANLKGGRLAERGW
ncbi:hypothetical protein FB45DRAFT_911791 [Roridomyces roridus]|uniref:pyridoxal 5'-phosphate synthase (glutamine hydrolyzing) n=1 Tax=Roridomyces roridus TaxID=1738132 RepID=A0AAD7BW16_9AGAR|nr:hypothetical protein FB45DRAFT_911791 [Roridomyces roridus]